MGAAAGGGVQQALLAPAAPLRAALLGAWRLLAVACGVWLAVFWQQLVFSRCARPRRCGC